MARTYTETDLGVLVAGEWTLVGGLGAERKTGEGVVATLRESPDSVWNHTQDVALPFPFTLEQFRAFCAWHPTFEWEAVESPFTNDDGSLDVAALGELAKRGAAAAELARRFLTGDADDELTVSEAAHQYVPTTNKHLGGVASECANSALSLPFKRAALLAAHVHQWPTIARDIADAKINGLAAAAKAGERGWHEHLALDWARANGKLRNVERPAGSLAQAMHNMGDLPGRRHTLQG